MASWMVGLSAGGHVQLVGAEQTVDIAVPVLDQIQPELCDTRGRPLRHNGKWALRVDETRIVASGCMIVACK